MATALIDADILAYRSSSVGQLNVDWQDGNEGATLSEQQALDSAEHILKEWTKGARCKKSILCFSDKENFRKKIYPKYKANRKGEKPELLNTVIEYLKKKYEWYSVSYLEADDVMGIYATSEYIRDAVIVSTDKDLNTIPAHLFNPDKDRAPHRNRTQQADYFWMKQVLTGDSSDGYKGIEGIGPKKAEKILATVPQNINAMWQAVVQAYIENKKTEQDALTQARLSRILRNTDYNANTMEVSLWHPTTPMTLSITPNTTKGKSNPLNSSKRKNLDTAKATSSSTLSDGKKKEELKTSKNATGISINSSNTKKKSRKKNKAN